MLKIVKNGVLREWGFKFCLRFRRHFFRRPKSCDRRVLKKKNVFDFGLKSVIEKCVGCFLVYLFLKVLFFKKRYYGNRGLNFSVKLVRRLAAIRTAIYSTRS